MVQNLKTDEIVENVINKYKSRSEVGIKKYGTTLQENNKDSFLNHLQQELMDATLYIEKEMSLKKELIELVKLYPNDLELGCEVRKLIS